jgi:aminoglycoside phosphotransferase (APT) family kinase protein
VEPAEVTRAIDAALSIVTDLGLPADEAVVLQRSNKLALRVLPGDVFARVAPEGHEHAAFEVELAQRLADTESPVAVLDPRVEPRGHRRDGFEVTLWTWYDAVAAEIPPAAYADALGRLHAGLRRIDLSTPHFTDRVAEAQELVASRDRTPALADGERALLSDTLRSLRRAIGDRRAPEQLLHGEPHPGNVIGTADGPVFIDLETCCRGPVEFDLAHVPTPVSERFPEVDDALLRDCRQLVLAMVAAWRWDVEDRFPDGPAFGRALLDVLRAGAPWPTLDELAV